MTQAFIYGLVAGLALLLGALYGLKFQPSKKTAAMIMAFGSGVLMAALTFELLEEAYKTGGLIPISIGFIAGASVFVTADWFLGRRGAHHRKRLKGERSSFSNEPQSLAIAFGALLDGVPESIMIGAGLLTGKSTGILMFAAVFLSNLPEGISGVFGISKTNKSKRFIILLWASIAFACGIASLLGFKYLAGVSGMTTALVSAIAAGSILAMITDTMIPEAFEEGGVFVALSTVIGFLIAFVIAKLA